MRWEGGRRSSNIEDRRGMGRGLAIGGGGLGLLGLLFALLFGGDPGQYVPQDGGGGAPTQDGRGGSGPPNASPEEQRAADFVSAVLADTEDTWPALLQQQGVRYVPPKLVLFTQAVRSACGGASAAMGPFYCPVDSKVYLDLGFFGELEQRFGAEGDFAQAYVVAHEVAHHVQNLMGLSGKVHQARQRARSEEEANALSVRLELQADCLAGVWAHHADAQRQLLESGDVEEGLRAASAIGDDTLQRRAQGHVVPESFTHGSSAQRVEWFRRGMSEGRVEACDTFSR